MIIKMKHLLEKWLQDESQPLTMINKPEQGDITCQ